MSRSAEALSHPAAIIRLTLLLCCSAINPARTSLLCPEMIRSSKLQDRRLSAALPTLKQERDGEDVRHIPRMMPDSCHMRHGERSTCLQTGR
mmetsp:Transcript_30800/g.99050  ORF Transcript_30800/g.99050 Transcript_30800/m.99050 type:complete len:92 (-) Transcript_30800:1379-1654(-)